MKQKGFAPIFVLIAVLIIAAIGGVYYFGTQKVPTPVVTPQNTTPSPILSDETANWKVFSSKEFEFSLKYPGDYREANTLGETHNPSFTFFSPDYQSASGGVNPEDNKKREGIFLQVFICKKTPCYFLVDSNQKNKKDIIFQGRSSKSYDYINTHGDNQLVLDILNDNYTYTLTLDVGPRNLTAEDRKLFELFVSTFKFLDFDETVNWKTYTNEFGYQFSYPPDWQIHPENNAPATSVSAPGAKYPDGYFTVSREAGGKEMCEMRKKFISQDNTNMKQSSLLINGYTAIQFDGKGKIGDEILHDRRTVFVAKGDTCFTLNAISNNNTTQMNILNQILSTFRFG